MKLWRMMLLHWRRSKRLTTKIGWQEADCLSEEEESSDLAQLFPFTGDVIKMPRKSYKKMTIEERRAHNRHHLKGKKKTATERLIQEQQADLEVQKWKKQGNAERLLWCLALKPLKHICWGSTS